MARTYRGVELRYGLAQRLALTLLALTLGATTQAEITVDGSLGSFRVSLAGPAFQIDANLGKQIGTNLFTASVLLTSTTPKALPSLLTVA
ncbi:MAG: hypothetical protein ACREYF_12995 [Gammaproteobacteria bacterium]